MSVNDLLYTVFPAELINIYLSMCLEFSYLSRSDNILFARKNDFS